MPAERDPWFDPKLKRLLSATFEFCSWDQIICELKHRLRPCAYFERPDWDCNDSGVPVCRHSLAEVSDYCEPCREREANKPAYREALKKRAAAKRRMRRCAKDAETPASNAHNVNASIAEQLDRMEATLRELAIQGVDVSLDLARIEGTRRTIGIPGGSDAR